MPKSTPKTPLYTIGHSTHTLEEFIEILHAYKIKQLVDVRSIPKSRRVPWFNSSSLASSLEKEKIKYTHMPLLGGLRKTQKNSINQGWENLSFRGFADYMQTQSFQEGLEMLNSFLKPRKPLAIMCAEALPWRCHRSLISDAEIIRNIPVFHIMSKTKEYTHKLTSFAVVNKTASPPAIYYP